MHVHVSPSDGTGDRWTKDEMKGILRAIGFYQRAITSVMPPERKDNLYAKPNMIAEHTRTELKSKYSSVETKGWGPYFAECGGLPTPVWAFNWMGGRREVAWNFSNVGRDCGTVEFRAPPGVMEARRAVHWAGFTLGFIQAAISMDLTSLSKRKYHSDSDALLSFISQGIRYLDHRATCDGSVVERWVRPDNRPPTVLTRDQLNELKRKLIYKNDIYAHKV